MGLINLGNGLSEMGNAIAQTAGTEALTAQKEQLEEQREMLIDQLATKRETNLATLKEGLSEKQYAAQKAVDLSQIPAIAKATAQAQIENAQNPDWVKAQRTITDATATVEQRAAAALYSTQAIGASIQNATAAETLNARKALSEASQSGDPDAIKAAETRLYAAQYSMHDDVQRAATLTAQENNDRLQVTAIQSQLDAKEIPSLTETDAQRSARLQQVERLKADLEVAKSQYATSHALAQQAAQNVPTIDLGGGTSGAPSRPPLSAFDKSKPTAPAPQTASPPPSSGMINNINLGQP